MKREVLLTDISTENLYRSSDMAKLNAGGCAGCSYCCREMTDTIILDPWDVYSLAKGLGDGETDISLEFLMAKGFAALAVYEGLTLPHLTSVKAKDFSGKMELAENDKDEENKVCVFLDENGRSNRKVTTDNAER